MLFLNQTEVYVLLAVCAAAAVGIIAIIVLSIWILLHLKKRKAMSEQASDDGEEAAADEDASEKAKTVTGEDAPEKAKTVAGVIVSGSDRPGASRTGQTARTPQDYGAWGARTATGVPASGGGYPGAGKRGKIVCMPRGVWWGAYAPYPMAYRPYYMCVVYPNAACYYNASRYNKRT